MVASALVITRRVPGILSRTHRSVEGGHNAVDQAADQLDVRLRNGLAGNPRDRLDVSIATCALTCPGASTHCSTAPTVPMTSGRYFASAGTFSLFDFLSLLRCGSRTASRPVVEASAGRRWPLRIPRLDGRFHARDLRVREFKILGREESAGFHTTRSWPATISRFTSTAFSSSASSAMRS